MDTYVCTIAGGKGGVGRTTTALNLGVVLQERMYDTVVVDADLGMANVARLMGIDPDVTVHDVLAGEAAVEEALVELDSGLTILPGAWELEAYAGADAGRLGEVVDALRDEYEVVLVDTSAGISNATAVPMGFADGTVLVTTTDEFARYDTKKTAQLAERVGGSVLGVVLTFVTDESQLAEARDHLDVPVLGAIPREFATLPGEPLAVTSETRPAGEAYRRLTDRVVRVVSDGVDPADLGPAFDAEWIDATRDGAATAETGGSEPTEVEAAETQTDGADADTGGSENVPDGENESADEDDGDDEDDEDDDGVLGLFN